MAKEKNATGIGINMSDNERLSRLKRLKALADRGIGGEKENATVLLKKLCDKYHISPDQIESPEERKMRWFKHRRGEIFRKLMCQCVYKAVGKGYKTYVHGGRGNHSEVGTECTPAEAIEIELDYAFYSDAIVKEMGRLYDMFIQKNSIFPPKSEADEDLPEPNGGKEFTEEDILLYRSIKRQSRTLQIEE